MRRLTAFLVLAALAVFPQFTAGQRDRPSDSERKALFLFNFMEFVQWPADAFRDPSEAFRLDIIGRDTLDGALERLVADKSIDHRRIVVRHLTAPNTTMLPQMVFVSADEEPRLASILAAYCRLPVLTVSDLNGFASRGGVIGLVEDDQTLRFGINRTAATEARLQVSSKLFYLAVPLFSALSPCGRRALR